MLDEKYKGWLARQELMFKAYLDTSEEMAKLSRACLRNPSDKDIEAKRNDMIAKREEYSFWYAYYQGLMEDYDRKDSGVDGW